MSTNPPNAAPGPGSGAPRPPAGQPVPPAAAKPTGAIPAAQGVRPAAPGQPTSQPTGQPNPVKPAAAPAPPAAAKPAGTMPPAQGVRPAAPGQPTGQPTVKPTGQPTVKPTGQPNPAVKPTGQPAPAGGTKPAVAPQPTKPAAAAPLPAAPLGKPQPARRKAAADNSGGRRKLGQVLVDLGFLDDDQLWDLLEEARNSGNQVGQVAITRGLLNQDQLYQALAEQQGIKLVNLIEVKPTAEALTLVPETMAVVYKVLPLNYKDKVLTIAVSDPAHMGAADDLRNLLSLNEVVVWLAHPEAMDEVLKKCYAGKEESLVDLIKQLESNSDIGGGRGGGHSSIDLESMMELAESAPVRKLINMVFLMGIKDRASDIHFEPFEDEYKLRMKCDGVLYELVPPPRQLANAISSRIKVMSNLDITERRLPQDGRIELTVGGARIDMRVSILPTMFGESIVIRILDKSNVNLSLGSTGMPQHLIDQFREVIAKPNGIILVTGPTGSGKTTTLYAALSELNVIEDKIITTEDPVEYEIEGLVQCQINHEIGLDFASALRAILRQDPDKILVGEIRDLETAQIAVQASLTGHIVFSTLHTNDAPSTITRMRDMGLDPFLITATVEAILAQRLVRKVCSNCKELFNPSPDLLMELQMSPEQAAGKPFYYGRGCEKCNNSGYKGRMAIHELMIMTDPIRDKISSNASTDELRLCAINVGHMETLRDCGLRAIHAGLTTIEEIVRETITDN